MIGRRLLGHGRCPPGSILDVELLPMLGDLVDFPLLQVNADPVAALIRDTGEQGQHRDTADSLVHLKCSVSQTGGAMSDTGANSCLTDNESNLVRCTDIPPVIVGLALKASDAGKPTPFTCHRMGSPHAPGRRDSPLPAVPGTSASKRHDHVTRGYYELVDGV